MYPLPGIYVGILCAQKSSETQTGFRNHLVAPALSMSSTTVIGYEPRQSHTLGPKHYVPLCTIV